MTEITEPRPGLFEALRAGFGSQIEFEVLEVTPERTRVGLEIDDRVRQGLGLVHGGALVTLADITATIGAYAACPPGRDHVTVEIQTRFLRAARESPLTAEARPLRIGRRLSTWEVRITDPAGELVAFATTTCSAIQQQA